MTRVDESGQTSGQDGEQAWEPWDAGKHPLVVCSLEGDMPYNHNSYEARSMQDAFELQADLLAQFRDYFDGPDARTLTGDAERGYVLGAQPGRDGGKRRLIYVIRPGEQVEDAVSRCVGYEVAVEFV